MAQMVKNLPAMQETKVHSLGWEDPLEKEMATHSSILAWKISSTEEPGGLQSRGSQRVIHTGSDEHARNRILQAGELQQRCTPRVTTVIIMQRTWQPIIRCLSLLFFCSR